MARERLSEEQINRAFRLFYGEGLNLGAIAQDLGCGLYDLSPWLAAPSLRIAQAAVDDERARQKARAASPSLTSKEG
jgi:hypothetical protein